MDASNLVLVMGGARSGKSSFAERCAHLFSRVIYFATARRVGEDGEMDERIAAHQARRPPHWKTLEPPAALAELAEACRTENPEVVIIDCATLWLGWEMSRSYQQYSKKQLLAHLEMEIKNFVDTLRGLPCPIFVVSNETGCGIVPEHQSGRMFRDLQGALNARLAAQSRFTCFCMAGIPLLIRDARRASEGCLPIAAIGERWLVDAMRGA